MNNNLKRILVICQVYPIPENHGNPMRTMNFVRAFKEIYDNQTEIDLIYKYGKQGEDKGAPFENEYEYEPSPFQKDASTIIGKIVRGIPLQVSEFDNDTKSIFQSLVSRRKYDFILCRYLTSTKLCDLLPRRLKSRTIVDYDDVASSGLFDTNSDSGIRIVKRTIAWGNRVLLKNYEKKCMNLGAALFCSRSDMESIQIKNNNQNKFVVPNIFNSSSSITHNLKDGYGNGNILLFVGTLNYPPNIQGLIWFVNSIFKEFAKVFTDARLLVVGRKPTDAVKKLCDKSIGIELHSDVLDVKPFYQNCKAVVVPLLAGSGTRIKILEAAMLERPIFSTPVGAEGLDLIDRDEIQIFRNAKEFNEKYYWLDTKNNYSSIVSKAKSFVMKNYGKENFNQSFKQVLDYIEGKTG